MIRTWLTIVVVCSACGGSNVAGDAASADASGDAGIDKSASCAATFGSALTASFGRLDGTVLAVVPPNDQACAKPNMTHLIIQPTMGGAAYRMVVDVLSNQGSPNVWFHELDAPLAGDPWSDGWHAGARLDYVTDLAVHSTQFAEMTQATLVAKITSELELGAHISVFATSGATEPDSAHLVHRNAANKDGAIVISPDGAAPHYLLLRFADQTF